MKKNIILFLFIVLGFFLPISSYVELNHLMIVEKIGLDCVNKEKYQLYFRELLPKKGNSGIEYDYKIYEGTGNNINIAFHNIRNHTNKKIFLDDTQEVVTNCTTSKDLIQSFDINPKRIIHTKKNIKKELKS